MRRAFEESGRWVREMTADERQEVYQRSLVQAWRGATAERPFIYDSVWDLSRA